MEYLLYLIIDRCLTTSTRNTENLLNRMFFCLMLCNVPLVFNLITVFREFAEQTDGLL